MQTIKKIPLLRTAVKIANYSILRLGTFRSDHENLHRLAESPYPQGQQIINTLQTLHKSMPENEKKLIRAIEAKRKQWLKNHNPLVDGTLGEGGLYDRNVTVSDACKVSKPPRQSLLMYLLIREFKPKNVIELGTNIGISSAFLAAAIAVNNQNGQLVTLEVSPYRLRLAKELHRTVGLENVKYVKGLFAETLESTLADIEPIDFAFIDGHHQYQPTLDYFDVIYKHTVSEALFVFDDIHWSDGMERAWAEIKAYDKIGLSVDLNSMGICVRANNSISGHYTTGPIYSPLQSIL